MYVRRGLSIVPLSHNGTHVPEFFMELDVVRGNNHQLDYHPSAIAKIDGTPIAKWLENDALRNPSNYQDPDAQFNTMFSTVQRTAIGSVGAALLTQFEIPDSYTVHFRNGSELDITTSILFLPTADFNDVYSGE
ncbi:hypothetical protein PC129_g25456, partial [Phytophthora cactorum]